MGTERNASFCRYAFIKTLMKESLSVHKKNRVSVRIMGQEYKLVSDEPLDYMQNVANYVDGKMLEIAKSNKKLSTAMIAVLTSLNVADEYFKLLEEQGAMEKRDSLPTGDFETMHVQIKSMSDELEQRNKDYEKMVQDFEALMDNSSVYEEELQSLREKMNMISYELNSKEEQLKRSNQTVRDLRKQITEKDVVLHEIDELAARRENKDFQLTFEQFEE